MALNKNPAMSPSSSVHCGQYDTTYATIGGTLREAFADDTIWGDEREPACTDATTDGRQRVFRSPRGHSTL